jgi:hypothetical protein
LNLTTYSTCPFKHNFPLSIMLPIFYHISIHHVIHVTISFLVESSLTEVIYYLIKLSLRYYFYMLWNEHLFLPSSIHSISTFDINCAIYHIYFGIDASLVGTCFLFHSYKWLYFFSSIINFLFHAFLKIIFISIHIISTLTWVLIVFLPFDYPF